MFLIIVLAVLSIVAIAAAVRVAARDGYRQVPTR